MFNFKNICFISIYIAIVVITQQIIKKIILLYIEIITFFQKCVLYRVSQKYIFYIHLRFYIYITFV